MKNKQHYFIVFGLIALIVAYMSVFYITAPIPADFEYDDNLSAPILISHAGGEIDGHHYTNSVEAITRSISNQYKFIELDLRKTADNHIVALHDWKRFHKFSGYEGKSERLDLSQCKQRVLFDKFHPATAEDINNLFIGTGVFLVTDKIRDFDLLKNEIQISKDSMLVECFSYHSYVKALKKGIKFPMLSLGNGYKTLLYKNLCKYNKVKIVTCSIELIEKKPDLMKEFIEQGVSVFANTTNSKDFIRNNGAVAKLASGFYTDSVTP